MIAIPHSVPFQATPQTLQNSLTAEPQAQEQARVVAAMIPQAAIDAFALRFNAALLAAMAERGVSDASPLSKRLRAYASAGAAPVKTTSHFA